MCDTLKINERSERMMWSRWRVLVSLWLILHGSVVAQQDDGFIQGAWLPYWGLEQGKESLRVSKQLNAVSPVWYEVAEDGSLVAKIKQSGPQLKQIAKKRKMQLTPSIAIFDYLHVAKVLGNEESRLRHVKSIVAEVVKHDFGGIDIDYEAIGLQSKEHYFSFLTELAKQLHAKKKLLSVAVLPQWGDEVTYKLLPQTREVQDLKRIGQIADQVRVMAYDYTPSKAVQPGPIAPQWWVEQVIQHCLRKVPKEKLILGVHLYSFEWRVKDPKLAIFQPDWTLNSLGKERAKSFERPVVEAILKRRKAEVKASNDDSIFSYSVHLKDGSREWRVLQFPTKQSVQAKTALAKKYQLGGVYFWQLKGGEGLLPKVDQ